MSAVAPSRTVDALRELLTLNLRLGARGTALDAHASLLGTLPELDSMAVVGLVSAIETRFTIVFDDEDISARSFATLDSLAALVDRKTAA